MKGNYKNQCKSCPIHPWTDEGAMADTFGCLPSFAEMIKWKRETGKIWACHSNPKTPCKGFVGVMDERGEIWDIKKGLITEDDTIEDIYSK